MNNMNNNMNIMNSNINISQINNNTNNNTNNNINNANSYNQANIMNDNININNINNSSINYNNNNTMNNLNMNSYNNNLNMYSYNMPNINNSSMNNIYNNPNNMNGNVNNLSMSYNNINFMNLNNMNNSINNNISNSYINNNNMNINTFNQGNIGNISSFNQNINNKTLDQYPALIGLKNIGSTCFMNATLQCFSQIGELSKYFLSEKNRNEIINNNIAKANKNEKQLSPAYLELIRHLWNKSEPNKVYSPNNFRNIIESMNPLFKKGQPGDSKDFIIFILEQLHKELKKPCINYFPQYNNIPFNQYDKNNSFNHFLDEFKKEVSKISDLFIGIQENKNECLNCKNNYRQKGINNNPICYNYQIFNSLIFPLEEVKNMKNKSHLTMNNNIVNLDDCFMYYQKTEYFSGENRHYCNICNNLSDSNYTTSIFSFPNILILILNRGKDNVYNVKLDFKEEIDITNYALVKDNKLLYNLIGVITHIGESGPYAHFVASCKSSINNTWYRFNDDLVYKINNIYNEVINYGTPYILFYQKKK